MILLAASAAFVGFLHSLAPGHWLPIVVVAKTRRWSIRTAIFGALMAAAGHVLISNSLGLVSAIVGWKFLPEFEEDVERYGSLILVVFGLLFAAWSWWRHSSCHGHTHHGPEHKADRGPFTFLFMLGFSPCIAVVPVIATAAAKGAVPTLLTMISFSVGVVVALSLATIIATRGLMKLDHPAFEHYGDVLTGLGIALMGTVLFFFPI